MLAPYFVGLLTFGLLPPLLVALFCSRLLWRDRVLPKRPGPRILTGLLTAWHFLASYVAWLVMHA